LLTILDPTCTTQSKQRLKSRDPIWF